MTVLAIAHRAGNDPAALRAATALGVDVVEADVHHYRGRLEVRHSKAVGPLPWLWDDGVWTPTSVPQLQLAELLDALEPGSTLMLDLKGPGAVGRRVAGTLHARVPELPVLVCSRWWPGVDAFAGQAWARPVLTARNAAELLRLRRRVRTRPPYGVSVHRSLLDDPAVVDNLRARVALVMTWPVNSYEVLDEVLSRGANGVISDEPSVLRAVGELRRRP